MHGFNRNARNWEEIVWGIPPFQLGRVPKTALLLMQTNASLLAIGSGVLDEKGTFESYAMHNVLHNRMLFLHEFLALRSFPLRRIIAKISHTALFLDQKSKNTREEMDVVLKHLVLQSHIGTVYLVSSPTHIQRCLRDAISILDEAILKEKGRDKQRFIMLKQNLFATASDVSYFNSSAKDVVILEPPHRFFPFFYSFHSIF